MAKFCHNCGSPVREGTAFCGNCGTKLDTTPVTVPAPEVTPEPVAEAIPAVEPAPAAETVPAVEPAPIEEAAPAVEPVAEPVVEPVPAIEPVAEPVPVAVAPVAEPVAAVEPVVEAAPYTEPAPVEAVPYAAPAPAVAAPYTEPAPAPAAMPVEAAPAAVEPITFEAPSGPIPEAPATPAPEAEKKKGKGGLIALLVAIGVVMLALIGVGVWALINGGFGLGGNIIERIEKKDKVESGKRYAVYDEDFNDYIIEARWWDYDSTMGKPGMYTTDTDTLAFSIEVNKDAEDEIYYAYYYSKDKEFDKDDLEKPLYSTTISPDEYGDGRIFYNVDCSKKIQKGYYVVVVASDDSLKRPYIVAYADVK